VLKVVVALLLVGGTRVVMQVLDPRRRLVPELERGERRCDRSNDPLRHRDTGCVEHVEQVQIVVETVQGRASVPNGDDGLAEAVRPEPRRP
jgi:hypothetical protein